MKLSFTKMQAYGNDYVYMDAIHQNIENPNLLAKRISNRHFGVGSDGLVLICPSDSCDFRMRIFDPDGTEAEMCGNALRSSAKLAYLEGLVQKEELTVETFGGHQLVRLEIKDGKVENIHASIGRPVFSAEKIPVTAKQDTFIYQPLEVGDRVFMATCISWGNPHTVLFVEDVDTLEVEKYGPLAEHLDCFPKRTNVTFAQVVDETHIRIREWERGTGETLGCGTGCCSALVAAHLQGMCGRKVKAHQPGGTMFVEWDDQDVVHMIGTSHVVFRGEYEYEIEDITCQCAP